MNWPAPQPAESGGPLAAWNWAWRMAWRDSRRHRRRLLLYSASIVLGVAALVAIGSLGENLRQAIEEQAKSLLGADLVLASNSEFSAEQRAFMDALQGVQSREVSFTTMAVFLRADATRLVQVRGIEGGFPFYGTMETEPVAAGAEFRTKGGALLESTLMTQFGLRVGDEVKIGEGRFVVRGSLRKVPGESFAWSALAPRIYLSWEEVERTGLLQRESLVRYRVYLKMPPEISVPGLMPKLRPKLLKLQLEVDTVERRKAEMGRAMTNLYRFLNLVGFVALLLGGIGIASAIHVHIKQKLATVAILRSLGSTARQAFAVYLAQAAALGLVGAIVGAALGVGVQFLLPALVAGLVPFRFAATISWLALGRGVGLGLIVCLLFGLVPLLGVRRVAPLAVFRSAVEPDARRGRDPWVWVVYACLAAGLLAFSLAQAQEWRHGAGFALGIGLALAALFGMARLTAAIVKRAAARIGTFTWRQGLASLYRPDNRTVLLMVTLGLGIFLVLTLQLVQRNLVREILPGADRQQPDAVLFDIQPDQKEGVIRLLRQHQLPVLQEVPVVTMRLAEVKGRTVAQLRKDPRRTIPGWALRREYRSTYRDRLEDSEKLIGGTWQGQVSGETVPVPVSVEEGIAKSLQVELGDELVFDVQGWPVRTVVASLRQVDWRRLQPNFFVVFPRGVLEEAPAFHVVVTRVGSSDKSAQVQREVVRLYPNVSTIDLSLVLQSLQSILRKVTAVIQFMALFTLGTGMIVLVTSLLSGRFQRLRESVLLRTLGASRGQIWRILMVEYFCLGTLAAVTGIVLALAANWGLARFVFKVPVSVAVAPLIMTWLLSAGLTLVIGLLTTRGICSQPPLEVLRSEG